jgi:hypothetical protein
VFTVRYKLDFYTLFSRNSVFEGLKAYEKFNTKRIPLKYQTVILTPSFATTVSWCIVQVSVP